MIKIRSYQNKEGPECSDQGAYKERGGHTETTQGRSLGEDGGRDRCLRWRKPGRAVSLQKLPEAGEDASLEL